MNGPNSGNHSNGIDGAFPVIGAQLLEELARQDTELKVRLLRDHEPTPSQQLADAIRRIAPMLELVFLAAVFQETTHHLGARSLADTKHHRRAIAEKLHQTGLDLGTVLSESASLWKHEKSTDYAAELPDIFPRLREAIKDFPIGPVEALAAALHMEDVGARCRRAYEGVVAVLRRNDPLADSRLGVLGPEYVAGHLTLPQVATILGVPRPDAVALLEDHGFWRKEQAGDLKACLEKMRARRTSGTDSLSDPERVRRTVLATQRIEDVDARPWLKTHTTSK